MTFGSDDLAGILVAPDREFAGFAQGIILAWNPATFENTVNVRGAELHDLPVKSGVEALTYQPGDVVMLAKWRPSGGGVAQYWIDGRAVIPGAGRAEEIIAFMTGALGRAVASEVFADRITAETISSAFVTSSDSFVSAPDGPEVEADIIGDSALVYVGASIFAGGNNDNFPSTTGGRMSFEVSGETEIDASNSDAFATSMGVNIADGSSPLYAYSGSVRGGAMNLITGLSPGHHVFTAQYASVLDGDDASFQNRTIFVIAF